MYIFIVIVIASVIAFYLYVKRKNEEVDDDAESEADYYASSQLDKTNRVLEDMNRSIAEKKAKRYQDFGSPTFCFPKKEDVKQFSLDYGVDKDYLSDWYAIEVYLEAKKLYVRWDEELIESYNLAYMNKKLVNASRGKMPFEYIFSFDDIVTYNIQEEKSTITTTKTNIGTDTGSMIARTLVGAALFGDDGAIIGGATANKSATSTSSTTEMKDRTLRLTLNNFSMPMIEIHPAYQGYLDNLVSVLNIIIEKNKNK